MFSSLYDTSSSLCSEKATHVMWFCTPSTDTFRSKAACKPKGDSCGGYSAPLHHKKLNRRSLR